MIAPVTDTKPQPFFRIADTVGDGTGTKNAITDFTGTNLYLTCANDESLYIHRMLVLIEDSANPSADVYGNLASALTNGIQIYVEDKDSVKLLDITDPDAPIKSNIEYALYCYDVQVLNFGSGNDGILVRWTFSKAGKPLKLNHGDKIVINCNDDFTGLIRHTFNFQGERYI